MNKYLLLLLLSQPVWGQSTLTDGRSVFSITNFRTEGGVTLPKATVVYGTYGPRFPLMTIRDNVQAVHQLLTSELKVTHLRAIVGFSMGAQQAFQWAVSYPKFADRIVATAGTAKTIMLPKNWLLRTLCGRL